MRARLLHANEQACSGDSKPPGERSSCWKCSLDASRLLLLARCGCAPGLKITKTPTADILPNAAKAVRLLLRGGAGQQKRGKPLLGEAHVRLVIAGLCGADRVARQSCLRAQGQGRITRSYTYFRHAGANVSHRRMGERTLRPGSPLLWPSGYWRLQASNLTVAPLRAKCVKASARRLIQRTASSPHITKSGAAWLLVRQRIAIYAVGEGGRHAKAWSRFGPFGHHIQCACERVAGLRS